MVLGGGALCNHTLLLFIVYFCQASLVHLRGKGRQNLSTHKKHYVDFWRFRSAEQGCLRRDFGRSALIIAAGDGNEAAVVLGHALRFFKDPTPLFVEAREIAVHV